MFQHTAYMGGLTGLRDRLKVSLSGTPAEGEPTSSELSEQIKALRASHQVEAAPARLRPMPRAEAARRRVERPKLAAVQMAEPKPEAAPETVEEPKPADEEDGAPGSAPSFRMRVKRFQQRSPF